MKLFIKGGNCAPHLKSKNKCYDIKTLRKMGKLINKIKKNKR